MIIERVDAARDCFNAYTLAGTELTVGGVTVDLAGGAEEAGDYRNVCAVRRDDTSGNDVAV
jgi:hypothetical protein